MKTLFPHAVSPSYSLLVVQCLVAQWWTVARQAPLSMGFSSQEYWSGLPFPSPGDFPDPGIEPRSLASPALAGGFFIISGFLPGKSLFRPLKILTHSLYSTLIHTPQMKTEYTT